MKKNFFLAVLLLPINLFAEPLRVGVIQSLTGIAAEDGNNALRGFQLAAEDINSRNEQKIELIVEDDTTVPKEAVNAYQRLKQQGIKVILGSTYQFVTDPLIELAKKDKIVIFNTTGLLESFSYKDSKGFFFNNSISIVEDIKPFEQFLKQQNKNLKLTVLHSPTKWGVVQKDYYLDAIRDAKFSKPEILEMPLPGANTDFSTLITKLKNNRTEIVVLILNRDDIDLFMRESYQLKFKPLIFASKNAHDAYRLSQNKAQYNKACYSYPLDFDRSFYDKFFTKFSEQPRIFADASYDAVFIIYKALLKNSSDPSAALLSFSEQAGLKDYNFDQKLLFANMKTGLRCIEEADLSDS